MATSYNRIAGQSVERLAALSDGIFGVGMTLLVLDLRVPVSDAIRGEHALGHALAGLAPQLLAEFAGYPTALLAYWVNIMLLGSTLYASWGYSVRTNLLRSDIPSIAFIVLVQLNYAVAPGFRKSGRAAA